MKHNIRKSIAVLLPIFVVSLIMTSCKYEDGPFMSFRSKEERLVNTWKIQEANENDRNTTPDYDDVNLQVRFNYDQTYRAWATDDSGDVHIQDGLWDFVQDKEQIRIVYTDPAVNPDRAFWTIRRLKEKELWVEEDRDSTVDWFKMIPADSLYEPEPD